MSRQLITMEQAKAHSRITTDDENVDIDMKVTMASEIVLNYLKKRSIPLDWTSNTSPLTYDIPGDVQAATLLVYGELFENREASVSSPLSQTVMDLLERHRDPALA